MSITVAFSGTLAEAHEFARALVAHVSGSAPEPLDSGPLDPGTLEWVLEQLATVNPSDVETEALDRVPPGEGAGSTTAAIIAVLRDFLREAAADAR